MNRRDAFKVAIAAIASASLVQGSQWHRVAIYFDGTIEDVYINGEKMPEGFSVSEWLISEGK